VISTALRALADGQKAWRTLAAGPRPVADARWLCWMVAWRVTLGAAKVAISLPVLVRLVRVTAGGALEHQRSVLRCRLLREWYTQQSPLLPGNCLERSLLVHATWARTSASTQLVVGFRKTGHDTQGHTWVTSSGEVLLESPKDVAGFEPACVFDASGTRIAASAAA